MREEGATRFVVKVLIFTAGMFHDLIRPILPYTGFITQNSVKVDAKKPGDRLFRQVERPNYEDGLVTAHEKYTKVGDLVTIIGGGSGVTAVRASKIVGTEGKVNVFEGGKESVRKIINNIELNNVTEICNVNHAIVGKERSVYGGETSSADFISSEEVLECDVLELDCEGSEIDILQGLKIRPRVIILEIHPWLYSELPERPVELLKDMGYTMKYYSGHDGISCSAEEFKVLLKESRDASNKKREHVKSGARWPVVTAAVRDE